MYEWQAEVRETEASAWQAGTEWMPSSEITRRNEQAGWVKYRLPRLPSAPAPR